MPGFSDSTLMFDDAARLLEPDALSQDEIEHLLNMVGFADIPTAHKRLLEISTDQASRRARGACLPMRLVALSGTATPDGSLINFERYVGSVADRAELFGYLASNPRAVEILVKLFVGSQFLTEILLRFWTVPALAIAIPANFIGGLFVLMGAAAQGTRGWRG